MATVAAAAPAGALAQDEILVTGTRNTIQNSIEVKRESNAIVDALSADDIGDLPALSIGEALETLTGAASHREQGGASEIAIRGLGPFLGSTTFNGREASNGSGDRSVNFSQFPSELITELKIYKTQQANLIEGGVSGLIALETLKPLDYGKQRIQGEIKGNYNPDNNNITPNERDFGYRGTLSYVDQYEIGGLGEIGVSIGVQRNVATNPEQEYRSSSEYLVCRNDPAVANGVYRTGSGNCDDANGSLNLNVNPATGEAPDADAPFIFVPSSRSFRQNITDDERDAVFGAFQWRPTERLDINFDIQYSDRTFTEERNDLVFAEQRRIVPGVTAANLEASPNGDVAHFVTVGRVETNSEYAERQEEYLGGGLSIAFQANDRLLLSFDASYSDTSRREFIVGTRLQSEPTDIYGAQTPAKSDRVRTAISIPGAGADVPLVTLTNFDVNNHDLYADAARTRIDLNQSRENTIKAIRGDAAHEVDWGAVKSVELGVRYSELEYLSFPRMRNELTFTKAQLAAANIACRDEAFPESNFMASVTGGQPLITNVDAGGNVLWQGNSYATFDAVCLAETLTGTDLVFPEEGPSVQNEDVQENTIAGYIQANYDSEMFGRPVRGNFGVRIVNTDVKSVGLRTVFSTISNPDGTITVVEDPNSFEEVVGGNSYTEFLPSLNMVMDLSDTVILRGGVFRGLSRPGPSQMGFGRDLDVDDSGDPTSIADLVGAASASGNPDLKPLTSWNFDLAFEWYPNSDTLLAVGGYYKRFLGGYENTQRVELFEIDGQEFEADVITTRTDDDASNIFGVEITATHAFSYLPGVLSGLGAKVSYNFAVSDFEFEDENFGASVIVDEDGQIVSQRVGIVDPADIFGLSKHVLSAQVYYQIGNLDLQWIYKYRSQYFQQFISTPGIIRYVGDANVFEVRATYDVTDNIEVKVEGINLFDEPRRQYIPTATNLSELNVYGPRLFAGVRFKF